MMSVTDDREHRVSYMVNRGFTSQADGPPTRWPQDLMIVPGPAFSIPDFIALLIITCCADAVASHRFQYPLVRLLQLCTPLMARPTLSLLCVTAVVRSCKF